MSPKVLSAIANDDFTLTITFSTNEVKMFNMKPYLKYKVFESIKNIKEFRKIHIDFGTVCWQNGEGLSNDSFYIKGKNAN